jgi:hypothetical protein
MTCVAILSSTWLVSVLVCLQGFASGSLDDDAFAPRFFVDQGLEVMVSQSYSKNLGELSCCLCICTQYIWWWLVLHVKSQTRSCSE